MDTIASWYSLQGKTTANGESMRPSALTAAHKTLPFNTVVLVENLTNGRRVLVRINDRGPFVEGREIDLSKQAFSEIADADQGTILVRIYPLT